MGFSRVDPEIRKGDLVVTAVASHYVVGRVMADDNTQEFLHRHRELEEAIAAACALAAAPHRVFIFERAGRYAYRALDPASPR